MKSTRLTIERAELPQLLNRNGLRGIELGVACGDFAAHLWKTGLFADLWGVDAYSDHHNTQEYVSALKHVGLQANYRLLRMQFEEALNLFPNSYFDFVYIDGYAHTGEEAGKTIYQWFPKVKVGGIIAGHDYHPDWPLVMHAVDCFIRDVGEELMITALTKNPRPLDKHPSWAARRNSSRDIAYPLQLKEMLEVKTPKSTGSKSSLFRWFRKSREPFPDNTSDRFHR
ncbi:MAG: class I SAM-dependent methyltransferase [Aestuariivita sp.]|nr:class I SAM-dependent methyltransferase [Aestuariivita sp.]